jgi:hypothetical protein
MRSLEPLPAAPPPQLKAVKAPMLKVLDDPPPVRKPSAGGRRLAPMPFLPSNRLVGGLEFDDDHSSDEIGELEGEWAFPSRGRLPRFVPLQPEHYTAYRDPWSVYSVADMLRIYLPEISISTGLVAVAGVLGGRLFSRFAGGTETVMVLSVYLGVHGLLLALSYGAAKDNPSGQTRERMRRMLLGCFLLLTSHLLAHGLMMAQE